MQIHIPRVCLMPNDHKRADTSTADAFLSERIMWFLLQLIPPVEPWTLLTPYIGRVSMVCVGSGGPHAPQFSLNPIRFIYEISMNNLNM
jgi:hypothetical protein